jgi:hypothetical protein
MKRFLSSPFFLLAGLCFFLPFVTISCAAGLGEQFTQGLGEELGGQLQQQDLEQTLTGIDIVAGETAETDVGDTPIPGPTPIAPTTPPTQAGDNSQLWAIISLAAAGLGIFLSLLPGAVGPVLAIILGVAGAISLFLIKVEIDGTIPAQAAAFIDVKYEIGFWAALILFVVAAVTGLVRLLMRDRPAGPMPPPATAGTTSGFGPPPPAAPPAGTTPPGGLPPQPPPPPGGTPPRGTPPPSQPPP